MQVLESNSGKLKFPKEYRLHHSSLVEGLFRLGHSFYEFPFRVSWRILSPEQLHKNFRDHVPKGIAQVQMLVTVPKKKRKKAVDRVLMRRRIREAYRLNSPSLFARAQEHPDIATLSIALVYIHDKNLPYATVEDKMKSVIQKLAKKFENYSA